VATGVLHARDRFAAPAFAPLVNNLVVSAAYGLFWVLHHDAADPLHLSPLEVLVLGGGTTIGVVAFTAVPVLAARRAGVSLHPVPAWRDPDVRALGRQGAWAGAYLALFQVVLVAALVVGNTVEGGVVTWQLAYTYLLLPHALVSIPAFTAAYPGLARAAHAGDTTEFGSRLRAAVGIVVVLGLPATAALVALGRAGTRVTLFGASTEAAGPVADVLVALAPGLLGFGLFLLLTRAAYAHGEVRMPASVHLAVTAIAVVGMGASGAALDGDDVVIGMAVAHSVAFVAGTALLGVRLRRLVPDGPRWVDRRQAAVAAAGAIAAGAAMAAVSSGVGTETRAHALLALAAGGALGVAIHAGVLTLARVPLPYVRRRSSPVGVAGG
jgi:putative peptidoglycan lipid II flippase